MRKNIAVQSVSRLAVDEVNFNYIYPSVLEDHLKKEIKTLSLTKITD